MLSQRTGAPVICGYCERVRPGKFRIVIEPMLDPADFPTALALNQAIADISARHIREHLDQWCIFRPLWEPAPVTAPETARAGRSIEA